MYRVLFVASVFILAVVITFSVLKKLDQETMINVPASKTTNTNLRRTEAPVKTLSKKSYKIALYGDSMLDTMAEHIETLYKAFEMKYPEVEFVIYNYGVGGETVEKGHLRIDSPLNNRERVYPPISEVHPDVSILGSFAYNPFNPHDPSKHKLLLTELAKKLTEKSDQVYLLMEIAPLGEDFGEGPKGVEMTASLAKEHSLRIIELMKNAGIVAEELNLVLIDALTPSQSNYPFGSYTYTTDSDGIHPSASGHAFTAKLIVDKIDLR